VVNDSIISAHVREKMSDSTFLVFQILETNEKYYIFVCNFTMLSVSQNYRAPNCGMTDGLEEIEEEVVTA
jgi:hypothetical protein